MRGGRGAGAGGRPRGQAQPERRGMPRRGGGGRTVRAPVAALLPPLRASPLSSARSALCPPLRRRRGCRAAAAPLHFYGLDSSTALHGACAAPSPLLARAPARPPAWPRAPPRPPRPAPARRPSAAGRARSARAACLQPPPASITQWGRPPLPACLGEIMLITPCFKREATLCPGCQEAAWFPGVRSCTWTAGWCFTLACVSGVWGTRGRAPSFPNTGERPPAWGLPEGGGAGRPPRPPASPARSSRRQRLASYVGPRRAHDVGRGAEARVRRRRLRTLRADVTRRRWRPHCAHAHSRDPAAASALRHCARPRPRRAGPASWLLQAPPPPARPALLCWARVDGSRGGGGGRPRAVGSLSGAERMCTPHAPRAQL